MIQRPKTSTAYRREILDALSHTGIRQLAPGGKARAFADIVGDKIAESESRQFLTLANSLLPYASGEALDILGEIFGVPRIGRQDARSEATDQNFRFYVRRGTFGDINNGSSITIPAGVRIFTGAETGPVYIADAITLPADAAETFFSARSLLSGAAGNTPSGVFTRHNFTNYADSQFGTLLVTNRFGIVGGRDPETDDAYRFRIHLKIRSRAGSNEAALRFAILQIPGIQDVVFERAAGTFTVYVYGISPDVPVSLVQQVQQQIDDVSAFPLTGTAVVPDLVGISLATTVRFVSGVGASERSLVLASAVSAAENYLNNLRIGETLVINEIADRIRNADARILDIGDPNNQIPEIFVWRSRTDGSRFSRFLIGNYTPSVGERMIVEAIPNAIRLTVAS